MTGLDLINGAMRLIGVLASGETAPSDDVNDALTTLNNLLDSWSAESLIAFPVLREVFPMSSIGLQQTYTWGTGGNLNSIYPMRIQKALIQLSGSTPAIEFPMTILNVDQYSEVILKTLTSNFPLFCYIDDAYPKRNVNVWPVPTDSTNALVFYSVKPLTSAALNTSFSLPPGYLRALQYGLAVDLAPEYGKLVPPTVAAVAIESLAAIKRNNKKPVYLGIDSALRGMPAVYNWRTDGYER